MIVARNLLLSFVLCLLAGVASAGTVAVTTAADSGPGSLRQAILDANSGACAVPCAITYGSAGPLTIAPLSPLPSIDAVGVSIAPVPPSRSWTLELRGENVSGGSGLHIRGSSSSVAGVIINGFPDSGIVVDNAASVRIDANIIGLDGSGTHAVPNGQNGVVILGGRSNEIGSNTIGGNAGNGIYAVGTSELSISGNVIGKQYLPQGSGDMPFANGATGVFLQDVQHAQLLSNTIANNGLDGVATFGNSTRITIEDLTLPTLIYNNGLMPIDLGFDGITNHGRPVLTTADVSNGFMRVAGHVDAAATINVFASDRVNAFGIADAKTPLYAAKVDAGAFEFRFALSSNNAPPINAVGQWISATATTDATSELSDPLRAASNDQNYHVDNFNDSGPGSLRQAILDANAGICSENFPCRVQFDFVIPVAPPAATLVFRPLTPLPPITRSGIILDGVNVVVIDGSQSPPGSGLTISAADGPLVSDSIRNLTITNFNGPGILIDATANSILNPVIASSTITSNRGDGILVRGNVPFVHNGTFGSGNRIQFNTISNNGGNGVTLEGGFFELDTNTIESNTIGVDIETAGQAHLEKNTITLSRDVGVSIATTTPTAFKASIQDSIHSNAGAAIRHDPLVQDPPLITSATYDPATQTTTIAGSVTKAPAAPAGWTTTLDFFASKFPEADRRGSGEMHLPANVGQGSGTFTATIFHVDLGGMRVSATATPFIFQGFKGPPENDLFGQGFEYGTTSEFSNAIPVITAGCPANLPQIVSGSPTELRWMTVPGATLYNVWLRRVPGLPQMIGTTSGDSLSVSLGTGTYEWFVEALLPQCSSMKSDAARLTVPRVRPSRSR